MSAPDWFYALRVVRTNIPPKFHSNIERIQVTEIRKLLNMKIIHTDPHIIVIIKPGGMLAVPGRGADKQDCAVNHLRALFPDIPPQPAVHRLDMATSGLMVFARTKESHRRLCRQFEQREVEKEYKAVVEREIKGEKGVIQLSFRLDPDNRPLQIYDPEKGKLGITRWQKLGTHNRGTLIRFLPHTGRTHQLRLHAAHRLGLNSPIVGDYLYGSGNDGDPMLLHASKLAFIHPITGESMSFSSTPWFTKEKS